MTWNECLLSTAQIVFFVVGIHTQPKNAKSEINSLVDVYNEFMNYFDTEIGFIMGDYNYGGSYVKGNDLDNLRIDNDGRFLRLISSNTGTTVKPYGQNGKPYDRIYVAPKNIEPHIIGVGVDQFRDNDELSEQDVSGHNSIPLMK